MITQRCVAFPRIQLCTSFPWGAVLLVLVGIGVLGLIFRTRRAPAAVVPQYPVGVPSASGPTWNSVGTNVAANVGTGIGSGIAGGLASGLAVGAGVVAGEELARHLLAPDRRESAAPLVADTPVDDLSVDKQDNGDMGGADFGVSEDDSWDDQGSVGGDVSGDDWT